MKQPRNDPPWRNREPIRKIPDDVAQSLRSARNLRGWTLERASAETGVSWRHICHLEAGDRAPSLVVAHALIATYELHGREADRLRAIAQPHSGRSSPYRTGNPAPRSSTTHEAIEPGLSPESTRSDEWSAARPTSGTAQGAIPASSDRSPGHKPGNPMGQDISEPTPWRAAVPMGQEPLPVRRYADRIEW